jgi:hypothetical protein
LTIILILIGALATLVLAAATVLLLRTSFISRTELSERTDLSWKDYRPLDRLLDPADFDYLREKGVSENRIKRLRVERRKIYHLCLRSLARDFNQIHAALNLVVVQSPVDRSDLVAQLARQRVTFYRNLMLVEFRLAMYACGFERMPAVNLLQPVEILQAQLRQLARAGAAA